MFSRASDEWATPQDFYDRLHAEFGFRWDVAATPTNSKCGSDYFGPGSPWGEDALAIDWGACGIRRNWMNPPYSRVREFIAKADDERYNGVLTVALVPARTDTRWWHDHVWGFDHRPRRGIEVRFVKGRLRFGGAAAGAPFPSVVIVFGARGHAEDRG